MEALIVWGIVLLVLISLILTSTETPKETNIPGPWRWPIIGNAHHFIGVRSVQGCLEATMRMSKKYEAPLNRFWIGSKLIVAVNDPNFVQRLLSHRNITSKDELFYGTLGEATGAGIFTRNGAEWEAFRKTAVNTMHPKNIPNFHETVLQKVKNFCEDLDKLVDQGPFDFSTYSKSFFLEMIFATGLGLSDHRFLVNRDTRLFFIKQIDELLELSLQNVFCIQSLLGFKIISQKNVSNRLKNIPTTLFTEAKERMESEGRNYIEEKPRNYMDAVLKTAEAEGKKGIAAALLPVDFIIAGYDTQSVVFSTLILYLAMHQEYQTKLYEEMVSIFGDSDREVCEDDLKKMTYVEMCLKEALRHTTPAAVIRKVDDDIEIDGYLIPKGATIACVLQMVLNDSKCWERPKDFYPDHFLPENVEKRPKGAFLPFATGPRMCPGKMYSHHVLKVVLSTIVRKYHITTDLKYSEINYKVLLMREPDKQIIQLRKR
ncbi:cytochrome P450 [Nesidiocoris tenuis]|uniref:Cytochrome P450 n=1 Tax=Nesidiocoris tenuis TaxID=355587 RepID=A0ABN7AJS8_9HEMI|nr:cytochrome P450 [Nesidiocoris tenuis]